MINKNEITQFIEANLYKDSTYDFLKSINCENNLDAFYIKTAMRLYKIAKKWKNNLVGINDLLIAIRDYLLTFQIDLDIPDLKIPENNEFGVKRDLITGKYFASFNIPETINQQFVKDAFLYNYTMNTDNKEKEFLKTDPWIYQLTGFRTFKTLAQKIAVYGALQSPEGYTTLISLPTGGGKSLITQMMAYQREGLTIVIVPTRSLAIDQERVSRERFKVKEVEKEIFQYSGGVDAKPILKAIKNRTAKLLFISPEALIMNRAFADEIKKANESRYLKNIIIDEAHLVIEWGSQFRVEYQCLESWRNALVAKNPQIRTILLSATYEKQAIKWLKDMFSKDDKWIEVRCDSLRKEPRYIFINNNSYQNKKANLLNIVKKLPHPMIIYVARPGEAEDVKKYLEKEGIENIHTFTGLTTAKNRKKLIDEWVNDEFEIMVATSAFGVGVDKSDVRTVIHYYIPQNPNAYYQELGRGGRDGLPCLSVMCINGSNDLEEAKNRFTKKIMTKDKILGRWNSMYNNQNSRRLENFVYMDTSIKPSYNQEDMFDDTPTSDIDMNWNIYVLLLLRRYKKISIEDIIFNDGCYIFVIKILDYSLMHNDEILDSKLEEIHEKECKYFYSTFNLVKEAIINGSNECWSEMFYETYDRVSEYCAGCNNHNKPYISGENEFPLKCAIHRPSTCIGDAEKEMLGSGEGLVIYTKDQDISKIIENIMKKNISSIVVFDKYKWENNVDYNKIKVKRSVPIWGFNEAKGFMTKRNEYFMSGLVVVLYSDLEELIYDEYCKVERYFLKDQKIKIVHLLKENIYFEQRGKNIVDLIDGPVISIDQVYK